MAIKAWGLGLAAVMGISPGLLAQGTEPGRVWTHNTVNGSSFATVSSLGDRGGQVMTLLPGVGGKVRMISGASVPGGGVVWEAPLGYEVYSGKLDSADLAPVHGVITRERASAGGSDRIVLRVFSNSSTPVLQQVLAQQSTNGVTCGVHVTDNGQRAISWWFDAPAASVRIYDHDLNTMALRSQRSLPMAYAPVHSSVNSSGSEIFFTAPVLDAAINVDSGQVLMHLIANGGANAQNSLARANSSIYAGIRGFADHISVQVYRKHDLPEATYSYSTWFSQDYFGALRTNTCAVSPEGTLLATGLMSDDSTGALGVDIYDLSQSTHPRILRLQPFGQSPMGKCITRMTFVDSRTLACTATTSGDSPEFFVLQENQGQWTIVFQAEGDVDHQTLDHAGPSRLAVNAFGISGSGLQSRVLLFDLSTNSVELRSIPHASSYADLRLYASPGSRAQLLESTYLASNPITFTGIGTLYLGSSGLIRIPVGLVPASGYVDLELPLSNLVGQTRYLQSFATNPRQLGSSALQVTTVP